MFLGPGRAKIEEFAAYFHFSAGAGGKIAKKGLKNPAKFWVSGLSWLFFYG